MAASAYPGMPPLDIIMNIILTAGQESNLDVESILSWSILEKVIKNEKFQQKMIDIAKRLGYNIGKDTLEDWGEDLAGGIGFVMSVWSITNWAIDNLDPDNKKPIQVSVDILDPPSNYTVEFHSPTEGIFFGASTNTSTFGDGDIKMQLYPNGTGAYNATCTTRREYTQLGEEAFTFLQELEIMRQGDWVNNSLYGDVTLRFHPAPEFALDLASYIMKKPYAEGLLHPYFERLDGLEISLAEYIEVKGTGILSSSNPDIKVRSSTKITSEEVSASIYSLGNYSEREGDNLLFNATYGPMFKVPLDRTNLNVETPFMNNTMDPEPDNMTDGSAFWAETPGNVIISSFIDTDGDGVPDSQEEGDWNKDGVEDSHQGDVAVIHNENHTIAFTSTGNNFTGLRAENPSDYPEPPLTLPCGLYSFNLTITPGSQVNITLHIYDSTGEPLDLNQSMNYCKYTSNGTGNPTGEPRWYKISSTIMGNTLTFIIEDEGIGDMNQIMGVIWDPGGPGEETREPTDREFEIEVKPPPIGGALQPNQIVEIILLYIWATLILFLLHTKNKN
jgi:hypothetical protein